VRCSRLRLRRSYSRTRISPLQRHLGRHRRSVRAVPACRGGHGARLRVPPRRCPDSESGATADACVVSTDLELAGRHIRKIATGEAEPQWPVARPTNGQDGLEAGLVYGHGGRRSQCRDLLSNLDERLGCVALGRIYSDRWRKRQPTPAAADARIVAIALVRASRLRATAFVESIRPVAALRAIPRGRKARRGVQSRLLCAPPAPSRSARERLRTAPGPGPCKHLAALGNRCC
jgi:hypothetical protein